MSLLNIFTQGFFLQAGLILALGAQNIFVLHSGLRKQRHLLVASICSVCDALLIFLGVFGVAAFFIRFPMLKIGLGVLGVGFLIVYSLLKLKEAKDGVEISQSSTQALTTKQTVLASLGFSLLNPHVYLDTVVLVGGYSAYFDQWSERFYFAVGASAFSLIWFFGISLFAFHASRFLRNPMAMRGVSFVSGVILFALGLKLGLDVLEWMNFGLDALLEMPFKTN